MKNIEKMIAKAATSKVKLAPHFKTHQSHAVGRWFREFGVEEITVSSIRMARYFAEDGWKEIFIAIPVNILEINDLQKLTEIAEITVLVADPETVVFLADSGIDLMVNIEIDTGYHRSGVDSSNQEALDQLVRLIHNAPSLHLRGFYTHDGNTYSAQTKKEVEEINERTVSELVRLRSLYPDKNIELSLGDTPSCSMLSSFKEVDIIRPGNYVFYDLVQEKIGSCTLNEIAVAMACPVISVYQSRGEAVIYAGGVHFSKESMSRSGETTFGLIVRMDDQGCWTVDRDKQYGLLRSISQEHGIIKVSQDMLDQLKVGSIVGILPVHSCMTADKMGAYFVPEENRYIDHLSSSLSQV